jgi:hypothetical protein
LASAQADRTREGYTWSGDELKSVIITFYTDTEHELILVTKGVQLGLQYDIEVVREHPPAEDYDRSGPLEWVANHRKRTNSPPTPCLIWTTHRFKRSVMKSESCTHCKLAAVCVARGVSSAKGVGRPLKEDNRTS